MSDQARIRLTGRIHTIFPAEINNNFEKRIIWLEEVLVNYPQTWPIEFQQGNCNLLDRYMPGDMVEVMVNIRGSRWVKDGKENCMSRLVGWNINLQRKQPTNGVAATQPATKTTNEEQPANDLPF